MTKNYEIEDVIPKTSLVEDTTPGVEVVQDVKPYTFLVDSSTLDYTTPVPLGRGMPMGLLLAITYPTYSEVPA